MRNKLYWLVLVALCPAIAQGQQVVEDEFEPYVPPNEEEAKLFVPDQPEPQPQPQPQPVPQPKPQPQPVTQQPESQPQSLPEQSDPQSQPPAEPQRPIPTEDWTDQDRETEDEWESEGDAEEEEEAAVFGDMDTQTVAMMYGGSCLTVAFTIMVGLIPYLCILTQPIACVAVPLLTGFVVRWLGDQGTEQETDFWPPVIGAYIGSCLVLPACYTLGFGGTYMVVLMGLFGASAVDPTGAGPFTLMALLGSYGALLVLPTVTIILAGILAAIPPVAAYVLYSEEGEWEEEEEYDDSDEDEEAPTRILSDLNRPAPQRVKMAF